MKNYFYILLFFFMLLACTKNKSLIADPTNDSIAKYITLGGDKKLTYEKRNIYNEKALTLLLKAENDSLNREGFINIIYNYSEMYNWKKLKNTTKIVLKKSEEKQDEFHLGQLYRWIGIYYENRSVNDSAFYYYSKAEKFFKKIKNEKYLCFIYQDKAQVEYYVNDYLGAEVSLVKALEIAKKQDFIFQKIRIYASLGLNSTSKKEYNDGLRFYGNAIDLSKKNQFVDIKNTLPVALGNIAEIYYKKNNYKKAISYVKESLKIKNCLNEYPSSYCFSIDYLAHVKLKLKQYKDIEKLHFNASKIRDSLKIEHGQNYNRLFLSEYYQATKQPVKAKLFAQEAYDLSKSYRNAGDMMVCLKQLAIVEPEKALLHSQEYIRISDSMHQQERETRNKFAKIAYETEEITIEKDQAIYQKWIFLGIAITFLVFGVLIFTILKQRSRQKEFQFIQEQQKTNEAIYELIQSQQTKIEEGRQIEKKRIAKDLHDGIMNRLTSTRLNLHLLNENSDRQTIKKCLPFIDGIQNIEKEIRSIAHDLNAAVFSSANSFKTIIETLFEEQKNTSTANCHLEIDQTIHWEHIESTKKIHLYRILQEALQNTNKHAQAKTIVVSIMAKNENVVLEIYDDGVGFSLLGTKKGIGLQNIYARVKEFDGKINIKSKKGTTITINIPI